MDTAYSHLLPLIPGSIEQTSKYHAERPPSYEGKNYFFNHTSNLLVWLEMNRMAR